MRSQQSMKNIRKMTITNFEVVKGFENYESEKINEFSVNYNLTKRQKILDDTILQYFTLEIVKMQKKIRRNQLAGIIKNKSTAFSQYDSEFPGIRKRNSQSNSKHSGPSSKMDS